MSFRKRPETADAWVASAPLKSADEARPWVGLDPHEAPSIAFNLRLNHYELALLRAVAAKTRRSQQQAAKSILVPALERTVVEPE
jgi:hypothetical protein